MTIQVLFCYFILPVIKTAPTALVTTSYVSQQTDEKTATSKVRASCGIHVGFSRVFIYEYAEHCNALVIERAMGAREVDGDVWRAVFVHSTEFY